MRQEMDAYDDFAWLTLQQLRATRMPASRTWFMRLGIGGSCICVGSTGAAMAPFWMRSHPLASLQENELRAGFLTFAPLPRRKNLAYTDLGLGLHTDKPVSRPGARISGAALQSLPAADGGDNLFTPMALPRRTSCVALHTKEVRSADAKPRARFRVSCQRDVDLLRRSAR